MKESKRIIRIILRNITHRKLITNYFIIQNAMPSLLRRGHNRIKATGNQMLERKKGQAYLNSRITGGIFSIAHTSIFYLEILIQLFWIGAGRNSQPWPRKSLYKSINRKT
jgi:hypothetical protein